MTLKKIKQEMKAYRDLWGGELIDSGDIDKAKTKKELAEILDKHNNFMTDQLEDARSNMYHFKERIGLTGL
jgi:hypothetical protein